MKLSEIEEKRAELHKKLERAQFEVDEIEHELWKLERLRIQAQCIETYGSHDVCQTDLYPACRRLCGYVYERSN